MKTKKIVLSLACLTAMIMLQGCDTLTDSASEAQAPGIYGLRAWNGVRAYTPNQDATANRAHQTDGYGYVGQSFYMNGPTATVKPSGDWSSHTSLFYGTLPPGLSWDTGGNINGTPTEAGYWEVTMLLDDIKCDATPGVTYRGFHQFIHFHIYENFESSLVGQWKGNSVDDTFNIEYRNSNLTYQGYDEASVLLGPKNVSIGADNSINLLGWYKDGTSRTFYLQDNQQLTTSQTSQNSSDNTYHANTYRREQ